LDHAEAIRQTNTPYKSKLLANQEEMRRYPWQVALSEIIKKSVDAGAACDPQWEANKDAVMLEVLRAKFQQCAHCRDVLLSTGTLPLAEHTSRDDYWGDGGEKRKGKNMLGTLLMQVRGELQSKASASKKRARDDEEGKEEEQGEKEQGQRKHLWKGQDK
jgi:ribA/ribD-fused uncharacterized protein